MAVARVVVPVRSRPVVPRAVRLVTVGAPVRVGVGEPAAMTMQLSPKGLIGAGGADHWRKHRTRIPCGLATALLNHAAMMPVG